MKRKKLDKISLFRVVAHSVIIDNDKKEHHFPCDLETDYMEWSEDLDAKLNQFNNTKFTCDMVGDADGIELMLWSASVNRKLYNRIKKREDFAEILHGEVNYDFAELKVNYKSWQEIAAKK